MQSVHCTWTVNPAYTVLLWTPVIVGCSLAPRRLCFYDAKIPFSFCPSFVPNLPGNIPCGLVLDWMHFCHYIIVWWLSHHLMFVMPFNYMLRHTVNTITMFWFCVGIIHVTPYSEHNYHDLVLHKHTCMLLISTGVTPYNDNNIIYMCRLVIHVSEYMLRHVLIIYIT